MLKSIIQIIAPLQFFKYISKSNKVYYEKCILFKYKNRLASKEIQCCSQKVRKVAK